MSNRPVRVTGFTRFFLVMLIVAPLAYIGASYYNGQDGIQNFKRLLKLDGGSTSAEVPPAVEAKTETLRVNEGPSTKALEDENKRLREELEFKKKRIDELYLENEGLKRKLESAEKVVETTKH